MRRPPPSHAAGRPVGTNRRRARSPGATVRLSISNDRQNDWLENELAKELENGRMFRLLSKLAFINERPHLGIDTQWAETGDRYLLKLFRDYLFHQYAETGEPWIDMAHVVQCLNKLDAGFDEQLVRDSVAACRTTLRIYPRPRARRQMLVSRDGKSMLIVSYADIKRCAEHAFAELQRASRGDAVAHTL